MKEQESKTFHLNDIRGDNLDEVFKYLAGFAGSVLGFYAGKKVYTKIMGEATEIEALAEKLIEGKEIVDASPEIQEKVDEMLEENNVESLEQLEELTGVALCDDEEKPEGG